MKIFVVTGINKSGSQVILGTYDSLEKADQRVKGVDQNKDHNIEEFELNAMNTFTDTITKLRRAADMLESAGPDVQEQLMRASGAGPLVSKALRDLHNLFMGDGDDD